MADVDDLLQQQESERLRAVIESVEGDDERVKVTPWMYRAGCLCSLSLVVLKSAIDSVESTDESDVCCGKHRQIVEITFKDSSPSLNEIFSQLVGQASEVPAAPLGRSPRALPPFTWERPEFFPGAAGSGVVYRYKDPVTHKIVCQCICVVPDPDEGLTSGGWQTFEERADCGTLSGIRCSSSRGDGKLGYCSKEAVEIGRERVQDNRPAVMG